MARLKRNKSGSDRGFTILEALSSLLVVAFASAAMLRVIEFASLTVRTAQFAARATLQVHSVVAGLSKERLGSSQHLTGTFPNGDDWTMAIAPAPAIDAELSGAPILLYELDLEITARDAKLAPLRFRTIVIRTADDKNG